MPVGLEERADVDSLAAPEVAVDGPVKRQLQRAFIQDSTLSQYLFFPSSMVSTGRTRLDGGPWLQR